jgi:hypothetical protein
VDAEKRRESPWLWRGTTCLAGAVFLVVCVLAARRETPTIDEFAHVPAGCAYWRHGQLLLYAKNPPLLKFWIALPIVLDSRVVVPVFSGNPLAWGPWEYGQRFMDANRGLYFDLFFRARLMVVVLGLLTGAVLYAWSRRVFGERAAAVAASLFLLSPAILAHGHLATIDVGCTFTVLVACWALRWACRRSGVAAMAIAGAAVGVALVVKFTALLILPVAAVLPFLRRREAGTRRGRWLALRARDAAIVLCAALLVVNAAYGMRGSFRRLDDLRLHSRFCVGVQRLLPGALPVPVPRDYIVGFDAVKNDTEAGEDFGSYLRGKWSREGWWYYNLVAVLVKTPLATLLLALAGIALWRRSGGTAEETWPILLPGASLFLFLSAFNSVNTGIRYVLPLYPFLHMAAGAVFAEAPAGGRARWRSPLAATVLVTALFTAIAASPDELAYFSPIAGGSSRGHEWLLDSNLDWGQDLYRVPGAVARLHSEGPIGLLYCGHVDPALYGLSYYPVPPEPVAGVLAVSVNFVKGLRYLAPAPGGKIAWVKPDHLAWLASHEPVARLGSIWVYDTRNLRDSGAAAGRP